MQGYMINTGCGRGAVFIDKLRLDAYLSEVNEGLAGVTRRGISRLLVRRDLRVIM